MILLFALLFLIQGASLQVFGDSLNIPPEPAVHAPTIYIEKTPPAPLRKPKPKGPVLLDARPSFDYALGHLPGAISIRWEDYSQTQETHKGALDPDLSLLSRKLRYLGINPDTEVIVLGLGPQGHGEDGRIAWMLNYLGINKVRLQNVRNTPGKRTVEDLARNESVPPWNPKPNFSLRVKKSDVEKVVKEKPNDKIIIDVRDPSTSKTEVGIPNAITIPWTLFITTEGEPAKTEKVKEVLEKHKINSDNSLILYSENGVASGYVTFVLTQAGLHAQNYDGGTDEWGNLIK